MKTPENINRRTVLKKTMIAVGALSLLGLEGIANRVSASTKAKDQRRSSLGGCPQGDRDCDTGSVPVQSPEQKPGCLPAFLVGVAISFDALRRKGQ